MAGSSYITQETKDQIYSAFDNIFATFARDIIIILNPEITIISTSSSYNALYQTDIDNKSPTPVTYTPVSYTVKAIIHYVNQDQSNLDVAAGQQKLVRPTGSLRIKIHESSLAYLSKAKKVEFDGRRYSLTSDRRPHGMFGPKYYSYLLTPIDNFISQ